MLKLENIHKTFLKGTPNEHYALQGVNLHLKKGEFVTLIGTNGAGKSTIMNIISGNILADEGKVFLDNENITYQKEHKRAKKIGRIFQNPMLGTAPDMTVEENLAVAYSRSKKGLLSLGVTKNDSDFYRQCLKEFDMNLEDKLKTKVGLLSGGQRQAIALLMSTISTPKLLLLDEHTAALDPSSSEKVMEITKKIVLQKNITTLMITHNINQALKTGDRTIMLNKGKIALDLSSEQRKDMSVNDLLNLYKNNSENELDNDRMLFS